MPSQHQEINSLISVGAGLAGQSKHMTKPPEAATTCEEAAAEEFNGLPVLRGAERHAQFLLTINIAQPRPWRRAVFIGESPATLRPSARTTVVLTIKIPQLPRCARSQCRGRLTYEDRAAPWPWLSNVDSQDRL